MDSCVIDMDSCAIDMDSCVMDKQFDGSHVRCIIVFTCAVFTEAGYYTSQCSCCFFHCGDCRGWNRKRYYWEVSFRSPHNAYHAYVTFSVIHSRLQ